MPSISADHKPFATDGYHLDTQSHTRLSPPLAKGRNTVCVCLSVCVIAIDTICSPSMVCRCSADDYIMSQRVPCPPPGARQSAPCRRGCLPDQPRHQGRCPSACQVSAHGDRTCQDASGLHTPCHVENGKPHAAPGSPQHLRLS